MKISGVRNYMHSKCRPLSHFGVHNSLLSCHLTIDPEATSAPGGGPRVITDLGSIEVRGKMEMIRGIINI